MKGTQAIDWYKAYMGTPRPKGATMATKAMRRRLDKVRNRAAQDATLVNVRATKKRTVRLDRQVRELRGLLGIAFGLIHILAATSGHFSVQFKADRAKGRLR